MIHNILTGDTLNFKSANHEAYLYNGVIGNLPIFLLRQVDDFAVAAPSELITNKLFAVLQFSFKQLLKLLGILKLFNSLDINQDNKFIRISCFT